MKPEQKGYRARFHPPNPRARFDVSLWSPHRKAARDQTLSLETCLPRTCTANKYEITNLPSTVYTATACEISAFPKKGVQFSCTLYLG